MQSTVIATRLREALSKDRQAGFLFLQSGWVGPNLKMLIDEIAAATLPAEEDKEINEAVSVEAHESLTPKCSLCGLKWHYGLCMNMYKDDPK